jgi:hypothetical protein
LLFPLLAHQAFASNLPLVLYAWYLNISGCAPLGASARFILSSAVANLAGPLAFSWWNSDSDGLEAGRGF